MCTPSAAQIAGGMSCLWRDEDEANAAALAPEPARREIACEDATAISARLLELERERLEAVNQQEAPGFVAGQI